MSRRRYLPPRYAAKGIRLVTRRDIRDCWRAVARIRRAAGDAEGARRAVEAAKFYDSSVKLYCPRCQRPHGGWDRAHRVSVYSDPWSW